MTKREIASLVIKLMGVFILLKSIAYLPTVFGAFYTINQAGITEALSKFLYGAMISISAIIPFVWSVLIIQFSDKAAAWLIKDNDAIEKPATSIHRDDVMTIAISCLGLYFIVAATPMLIRGLSTYPMYTRAGMNFVGLARFWNITKQLIAPTVQIGLGIWLFAGSRGIVKLWKKIRS
ncbi:MAG: hypothetical protein OEV87_05480 [Phycisphaerae bacterium]|nr:hypothetical protein [Phycisphaerae bacterium]